MRFSSVWLLLIALLWAGGALTPPVALGNDYMVVMTYWESTRCSVFQMDGETGQVWPRQELTVVRDSLNMAVSPDRRVVAIGGRSRLNAYVSMLFFGPDGTASPPVTIQCTNSNDCTGGFPLTFHPSLPLLYAGDNPIASYRYSQALQTVEPTSQTISVADQNFAQSYGYSPWSGSLVFPKLIGPILGHDQVQTLRINDDGGYGSFGTALDLPNYYYDFALSPDGRWAAVTSLDWPNLQLIRVHQDGSLEMAQTFSYYDWEHVNQTGVFFSPDNRFLIMVSEGTVTAELFKLDTEQDVWASYSQIGSKTPGWQMILPYTPAVTPDSRYLLFRSNNHLNLNHDWLHITRIHEDGTLEYLPGREVDLDQHVGALAIIPLPPKNKAAPEWGLYP